MARAIFGNHSSVLVPRQDRDSICKFYCDILGGKIIKADPERDFIRLGEDFYVVFLYGDVADESEFLRSARSVWLELKSHSVEEMTRKILDFDVRKLEYRTLTFTSRLRVVNASGWSASTRTSPFMRGPEKARTWPR